MTDLPDPMLEATQAIVIVLAEIATEEAARRAARKQMMRSLTEKMERRVRGTGT